MPSPVCRASPYAWEQLCARRTAAFVMQAVPPAPKMQASLPAVPCLTAPLKCLDLHAAVIVRIQVDDGVSHHAVPGATCSNGQRKSSEGTSKRYSSMTVKQFRAAQSSTVCCVDSGLCSCLKSADSQCCKFCRAF